jgi:hypothetical protein
MHSISLISLGFQGLIFRLAREFQIPLLYEVCVLRIRLKKVTHALSEILIIMLMYFFIRNHRRVVAKPIKCHIDCCN